MKPEKSQNEPDCSADEESKIPLEERFSRKLQFDEGINTRMSRKRLRYEVSPDQQPDVSRDLVDLARGAVEFISEKTPLDRTKVTNNFVTNLVELSDGALNKLKDTESPNDPGESQRFNMRFIKPSKKFYNALMSVLMTACDDCL